VERAVNGISSMTSVAPRMTTVTRIFQFDVSHLPRKRSARPRGTSKAASCPD
jgi:hypothetical protein